jgi:hypothetical protein
MKLKILFVTLFTLLLSVSAFSQQPLYKGIKSGMTEKEFKKYINSNSEFSWSDDKRFVNATIRDRAYLFGVDYNKSGKLNMILFFGVDQYEWYNYDESVKDVALELFAVLQASYGDPIYDSWPSIADIPDGDTRVVCIFEKENIKASILVNETSETYSVGIIILDANYIDSEPKSSEGF